MANKQFDLIKLNELRRSWKTVNFECLKKSDLNTYSNRKLAVDMYIDGYTSKEIEGVTNIKASKYSNMIKRCLELDLKGIMYGYTGLIPKKHIKKYQRKQAVIDDSTNHSGALSKLFEEYPEIKEYIDDTYLQRDEKNLEKNIKTSTLFEKFTDKCIAAGIKENEYPFNTNNLGKRSFYSYINELEKSRSNDAIMRYNQNSIQKYQSTGIGTTLDFERLLPYSRVQIDGHKVDFVATVQIADENGDISYVPLQRYWLLTLIDVATRTILGYHMTIKSEYDRFDILLCLKNAIEPRNRMNFTIPGLSYPDNGGYPSLEIDEAKWATFDEIELDNALSHHSQLAVSKITEELNSVMSFGPVSTPERRGIIERFYGTLEERGYHRTPSTTGSNINDARRRDCETNAKKFQITFQEMLELTEVLIAQYNLRPHTKLKNFSPIEIMRQRMERGMMPAKIDEQKQKDFALLNFSKTAKVRGSMKSGRRPYIQFEGTEYRGEELSYNFELIGETIRIVINPEDLRTVIAYKEDGSEIGILYVAGKWKNTPHTLKQRKDINMYFRRNKIYLNPFEDPIAVYHEFLNNKAKDNKAARNKLGDLQNTIGNKKSYTDDNVVPISQNESVEVSYLKNNVKSYSEQELLAKLNSNTARAIYCEPKKG
jgi:transposase InsO family protein